MQPHIVLKPISEVYGTTITNTLATLPSVPSGAIVAWIQVETNAVRMRLNATTGVTGGVGGGILLDTVTIANPYHKLEGYDAINRARLYRNTGADGVINVVYWGAEQP